MLDLRDQGPGADRLDESGPHAGPDIVSGSFTGIVGGSFTRICGAGDIVGAAFTVVLIILVRGMPAAGRARPRQAERVRGGPSASAEGGDVRVP